MSNFKRVNITIDKKIKTKYDQLMSLLNVSDEDIKPFIDKALNEFIKHKKKELNTKMDKMLKAK